MRTLLVSLFFLSGLIVALIGCMPVSLIIGLVEQKDVDLQAPSGVLINGSLVFSNNQVKDLPIAWHLCSLRLSQPLGICIDMQSGTAELSFGMVPWKIGNQVTLYNLVLDSQVAELSNLDKSLNSLALLEGSVITNLSRLVYNQEEQLLREINGSAQLTNIAALGLDIGNINLEISQSEPDATISMAFEGGDINNLVLQGTGTFEPKEKNLSISTVIRSNKPSVLRMLEGQAKKIGDNSYEWEFTLKL